jgi:hypothetical protein
LTVRTDGPISDAISRVLLPVHDTLEPLPHWLRAACVMSPDPTRSP